MPSLKVQFELAKEAGITLHPALETTQNEPLRSFSRQALPAGTVLLRMPLQRRLQALNSVAFPAQMDPVVALLHRLARELNAPQDPVTALLSAAMRTPEQLKNESAYYLPEADIKRLGEIHDQLPRSIALCQNRVVQLYGFLNAVDATLTREAVEHVALNAFGQGWFSTYFMPLTHIFRRCAWRGLRLVQDGNDLILQTPRPLEKDSEVFINLGKQDVFDAVLHAPGFDADLRYCIAYGARIQHFIKTPFERQVVQQASHHFPVAIPEGQSFFILQDPHALLMESGPSISLMTFFNAMSVATPTELAQSRPNAEALKAFVQDAFSRLRAMNHVSDIDQSETPAPMHKYVQAAQRDLEILKTNLNWASDAL